MYCFNNPVNYSDPSGYVAANIIAAIIGGIIGAVGGYYLANFLADKLNLRGWKRNVFVWGLTALIGASAAAIGWFLGPYVARAWACITARLAGLLRGAYNGIKLTTQTMKHINVSKHLWGTVMKKVSNSEIKRIINLAIRKGKWKIIKNGVVEITWKYKGRNIIVTGKVIDKIFRISDSWVKR